MNHLPSHYLFLLKVSTISVSGMVMVVASDCQILKQSIENSTGQFISMVALERIFGFRKAVFGPSIYTLNILANYCHFKDYQAYCDQQDIDENLAHRQSI